MKSRTNEKLPPVPSGTEVLDLSWRELTPWAGWLFENLPGNVSDSWASADGLYSFWMCTRERDRARREFRQTPIFSTVWRIRKRRVDRLKVLVDAEACYLVAALYRGICRDWPNAKPEQTLLLVQRRLSVLTDELFSVVNEAGELIFESDQLESSNASEHL